jgi:hypothetical protein
MTESILLHSPSIERPASLSSVGQIREMREKPGSKPPSLVGRTPLEDLPHKKGGINWGQGRDGDEGISRVDTRQ